MKLYDAKGSPNCRKVRVAARELGLPLELVPVDLAGTRDPEHLVLNPTGKVPTLVDDQFVLWESGAILVYLAGKRPESGLLPTAPEAHASTVRWLFFAATHVQPWLSLLGQERILKVRAGKMPDAPAIALAERELQRFLPLLEEQLATREYLVEKYSIADIGLGCGLEGCEQRGLELTPYPELIRWRERLRQRAAWAD